MGKNDGKFLWTFRIFKGPGKYEDIPPKGGECIDLGMINYPDPVIVTRRIQLIRAEVGKDSGGHLITIFFQNLFQLN